MFGARLAFDDYRKMLAHPDIDAVAVVLRVPAHYQTTLDAIHAGKHVFTEWPLGKTLAEAKDMAEQARRYKVQHMVGLQARKSSHHVYEGTRRDGLRGRGDVVPRQRHPRWGLRAPSDRTWQRDNSLGATTLTIPFGHTVDAFRFVVGHFSRVARWSPRRRGNGWKRIHSGW